MASSDAARAAALEVRRALARAATPVEKSLTADAPHDARPFFVCAAPWYEVSLDGGEVVVTGNTVPGCYRTPCHAGAE